MGILDFFRRRPAIRDAAGLADFIDQNAAFVAQKGIYEYSRARAGHYSKVLFREPEFRGAADQSRWRAFPLGLAMVAELAAGVLNPGSPQDRAAQVAAIRALTLSVFDRYPVHPAIGAADWTTMRAELERNLSRIGLHAPKPAKDVPALYAEKYVELMPIHPSLSGRDAPTIHNYLRVTMINIHEQLTKRTDAPAVSASLLEPQRGAVRT
jgi:hypothetical protein